MLLVEDNPDVATALAAALGLLDIDVRHVLDADAALELLETTAGAASFDFVLSDIQMPGRLNGIDLAEQVRERWPTLGMVLMTGYADELGRARRVGVPVLAKPFDISAIQAFVIESASRRSRAGR